MSRLTIAPTVRSKNPVVHHMLRELRRSERWSEDHLRLYQRRHLRRVLRRARTTDYWSAHIPDRLDDPFGILDELPTLTKQDILAAPERHRCRGNWPSIKGYTSGTTGSPLTVRRSLENVLFEEALVQWHRGWFGWDPCQRTAIMRGEEFAESGANEVPFRYDRSASSLSLSSFHLSPDTIETYVAKLRSFAAPFLCAYPSSALTLCNLADRAGLSLPTMKVIFTSSETLTPEHRQYIEDRTGARVVDYYGNAERTVAAGECEHGRYHFFPMYAVLRGQPSAYSPVVSTGLRSGGMALLNYESGDEAAFSADTCPCGRLGPTSMAIVGRADVVLFGAGGRRVGRLDGVFKNLHGVVAAQLVQRSVAGVLVRVVPGGSFGPAAKTEIERRLRDRLGTIQVDIELRDSLPRTSSGKTPFVIQELER